MSLERATFFYPEHPFQNKILQLLWMSPWEQIWLPAQVLQLPGPVRGACSGDPEGGQAELWAAATGAATELQHCKGFCACCSHLHPHPPHILCILLGCVQLCKGLLAVKQTGTIWLRAKKRKHHFKRVLCHHCSDQPWLAGLVVMVGMVMAHSEKPQLCTLWWQALMACLPRMNSLCHL